MFKSISLKNITTKAFISTLAAGSLLTVPGANEAVASNGVRGLELRYEDSGLNCGAGGSPITAQVEVYNQSNQLLTTMSQNDTFVFTDIDSVSDLKFKYVLTDTNCAGTYETNETMLLGPNDPIPSIAAFSNQTSISEMLVDLDSYEELFLVELGGSDRSSSSYDLQDIVLVVDHNPESIVGSDLVDVELVLAVDVSTSVDSAEFLLQRDGYVEAFESSAVQNAIEQLPDGLAVTMMFWSSDRNEAGKNPVHNIGWYKLVKNGDTIDGLDNFLDRIENIERSVTDGGNVHTVDGQRMQNGTDIASAIEESQSLIENNIYDGSKKIIDISGDGLSDDTPITQTDVNYVTNYISSNDLEIGNYLTNKSNGSNRSSCGRGHYGSKAVSNEVAIEHVFCPPVLRARDAAVNAGITINGLPIVATNPDREASRNREDEVDKFYEFNVIGGTGAFVEVATFVTFSDAVTNKIAREINYYAD